MGCLRLCGVRTAGEATRQAELSPFSIAPWATAATSDRVQHAVVVHPADGMISIIKVTVSRGRPPESHFRGSIGVLPVYRYLRNRTPSRRVSSAGTCRQTHARTCASKSPGSLPRRSMSN